MVCSGCVSDCDDTIHALWDCPILRSILEADELTKKFLKYKFSSFANLLDMFFRFKEDTDMNLLAMLFWLIWEKRNSDRVGGCKSSLQDMRTKALRFLRDFANIQTTTRQQQIPIPTQWVKWIPPSSPLYKVNYDGAIFKELGAAGLGVIIRDFVGSMIGALVE